MNDKNQDSLRFVAAIGLSAAVMYGYLYFFGSQREYQENNTALPGQTNGQPAVTAVVAKKTTEETTQNISSESTSSSKNSAIKTVNISQEEQIVLLENAEISVKFSTRFGAIVSAIPHLADINPHYKDYDIDMEAGGHSLYPTGRLNFSSDLNNLNATLFYKVQKTTPDRVEFVSVFKRNGRNYKVTKSWKLEGYQVWLQVLLEAEDGDSGTFSVINGSVLGEDHNIEKSKAYDTTSLSYVVGEEIEYAVMGGGFSLFGGSDESGYRDINEQIEWISIDNRFFMRALKGYGRQQAQFLKKPDNTGTNFFNVGTLDVPYDVINGEQSKFVFSFHYYPKSRQLLNQVFREAKNNENHVGNYQFYLIYDQWNWMRIITDIMYWLLMQVQKFSNHFAFSIILLTIFIKLVTFPLTQKSMNSMQRMQELNPKIKSIRENNKNKSQQANVEIMALYKKEGINPALGCLPMLIPIPIFIAFYRLFPNMFELNNAAFLWIENLSQPDMFMTFASPLPLIGTEFHLLPILMGISQFFQSMLTPQQSSMSEAMETQQKMMKYFFPIMFLFICWSLPSALVLFWFVNNLLSILQTLWTRKKKKTKQGA